MSENMSGSTAKTINRAFNLSTNYKFVLSEPTRWLHYFADDVIYCDVL